MGAAQPERPAFMAGKRYRLDDRAPYAWRTTDYGRTWTRITEGIGAHDYVHAIREDKERPGLLYAGTEHGIHAVGQHGSQAIGRSGQHRCEIDQSGSGQLVVTNPA